MGWYLTSKMPWRDKDGKMIGTFGVTTNVTPLKEAEARLENLHRQLLDTSRQAGMAEVATNVLHNVGNVLNSVNVSLSVVSDRVRKSRIANFTRATGLLREHQADLAAYLSADAKGAQLPEYLIQSRRPFDRGASGDPQRTATAPEQRRAHQGDRGHATDLLQGLRGGGDARR